MTKVICLTEGGGDLVPSELIEVTINKMLAQGWSFVQISTGAVSYSEDIELPSTMVSAWVYIIFEKE
ncbi:hypothetical protein KKC52_08775 [bacterium]|nr:hypothetical protein [bacterium]